MNFFHFVLYWSFRIIISQCANSVQDLNERFANPNYNFQDEVKIIRQNLSNNIVHCYDYRFNHLGYIISNHTIWTTLIGFFVTSSWHKVLIVSVDDCVYPSVISQDFKETFIDTIGCWLVVLGFNATLTAKVISWRSVTHMCFLAFSHQY